MKLQKFNGGLNTRLASHLIGVNEGTKFTNIDIESETLKPCKALLKAGLTKGKSDRYIRYEDDIIALAKVPTTFAEYQNKLYYSVDGDYPQCRASTSEGDLGLPAPIFSLAKLTTVRPVAPVSGDVTVTATDLSALPTFLNVFFYTGITYEFAFTKVSFEGLESVPYYYSYTVNAANTAESIVISLPYPFRVYIKVAGTWTALRTRVSYTGYIGDTEVTREVEQVTNFDSTFTAEMYYPEDRTTLQGNQGSSGKDLYLGSQAIDLTALGLARLSPGTYNYVATTGISNLGWESEHSEPIEIELTTSSILDYTVTVTDVDPRVDTLNIYRIGDTLTDFTLVDTIKDVTFPYSNSDGAPSKNIVGNPILAAEAYDKPIQGLTNLIVVNGQLVGTYGSKLYYSQVGRLNAIPPTNYRDFKNALTGVFQIDGGVLVFSADRTWLLNTSNLSTGRVIQLSDEFGCVGHNTIVGYKTGAMWASQAGLCVSAGGKVEVVTKSKLGFQNLGITRAVMHREVYTGFTDVGTAYAFDLRYSPAVVQYDFALLGDADITTEVSQVYVDGRELKLLFGSAVATDSYTVFGSTSVESLSWTSGKFIEGSYTELKTYGDFYVRGSSGLKLSLYIDDSLACDEEFWVTETKQIKIPQSLHQGYAVQFKVTGTGELFEVEYKAMGRQNGR